MFDMTCRRGHPLAPENVRTTAEGWRVCRACDRERHRAGYARTAPRLITCAQCGKEVQRRADARYCSNACRLRAHRRRNGPLLRDVVHQPRVGTVQAPEERPAPSGLPFIRQPFDPERARARAAAAI